MADLSPYNITGIKSIVKELENGKCPFLYKATRSICSFPEVKVDELKTNLATALDNGPGGARTRGKGGLERWAESRHRK